MRMQTCFSYLFMLWNFFQAFFGRIVNSRGGSLAVNWNVIAPSAVLGNTVTPRRTNLIRAMGRFVLWNSEPVGNRKYIRSAVGAFVLWLLVCSVKSEPTFVLWNVRSYMKTCCSVVNLQYLVFFRNTAPIERVSSCVLFPWFEMSKFWRKLNWNACLVADVDTFLLFNTVHVCNF